MLKEYNTLGSQAPETGGPAESRKSYTLRTPRSCGFCLANQHHQAKATGINNGLFLFGLQPRVWQLLYTGKDYKTKYTPDRTQLGAWKPLKHLPLVSIQSELSFQLLFQSSNCG